MTFAIHDQGGLTEAEIKLAIEESAERREAALDIKLSSHRDEINDRLGRTEDLVAANNERLMDLKGTMGAINAQNSQQTKLLESVVAKGDEWHEADVHFRQEIIGRVGKIETEQSNLTVQVKRLGWIATASDGLGKSIRFVFEKFCEADLWKLFALCLLLYLLHFVSPFLYEYVLKLAAH